MSSFILALDQGTTSSRAILFDRTGSIRGISQKEFTQHYPKPGWVEHDAQEVWATQYGVAQEVLELTGTSPDQIAAIGITNQRETTVVWDRETGEPVHRAIVWQDRRTAGVCDQLRRRGDASWIQKKTGLVLDAYFSGTKVQWILKHVAGAQKLARAGRLAFGTIDSWLIWKLTGGRVHATDPSNASRTLLYDLKSGDWDDRLLKTFDIPRSMLPEIRDSSGHFGDTTVFRNPIPICGVAGDQQSALFGQMCTRPGMVKNTYGTGCFLLMNTGIEAIPSKNKLLTTVAWRISGKTEYALEGSVFVAGAVVQWLRDGLGIIHASSDVEALAARVPDTGGVYLVPAFVGLGAPHWDAYARGTLVGLTRGTQSAHIARAALEGIAYQVGDILGAMQKDAGIRLKELRVDGGACRNNLLMQFQADILGIPAVRPKVSETTALGAAYLAGLGCGFWTSQKEISAQWQQDRVFKPSMKPGDRRRLVDGWAEALKRSAKWARAEG